MDLASHASGAGRWPDSPARCQLLLTGRGRAMRPMRNGRGRDAPPRAGSGREAEKSRGPRDRTRNTVSRIQPRLPKATYARRARHRARNSARAIQVDDLKEPRAPDETRPASAGPMRAMRRRLEHYKNIVKTRVRNRRMPSRPCFFSGGARWSSERVSSAKNAPAGLARSNSLDCHRPATIMNNCSFMSRAPGALSSEPVMNEHSFNTSAGTGPAGRRRVAPDWRAEAPANRKPRKETCHA